MFGKFFSDNVKAKAATQKDHEKAQTIRDERKELDKQFENSFKHDPFKKDLGSGGLGETKGLGSNSSLGSSDSQPFGGASAPKIPSNNSFNSNNFNSDSFN